MFFRIDIDIVSYADDNTPYTIGKIQTRKCVTESISQIFKLVPWKLHES